MGGETPSGGGDVPRRSSGSELLQKPAGGLMCGQFHSRSGTRVLNALVCDQTTGASASPAASLLRPGVQQTRSPADQEQRLISQFLLFSQIVSGWPRSCRHGDLKEDRLLSTNGYRSLKVTVLQSYPSMPTAEGILGKAKLQICSLRYFQRHDPTGEGRSG